MSINFYQTTRRHIPQHINLLSHRHNSLISYSNRISFCPCHESYTSSTHLIITRRCILKLSFHLHQSLEGGIFPSNISDRSTVRISHPYHACHMPFPSHPPWFYQLHFIWKRIKITKFPHYATFLFPCSFPFPRPHFGLSALSMTVFWILLAWNSSPQYWTIQFLPCSKDISSTTVNDDQQDAIILAYLFIPNQLYVFRAMSSPIIRSTWLYLQHLILSTGIAAG